GEAVIKPENGNQSEAKTAGLQEVLNADNNVSALQERTYQENAEIAQGETITHRNMNDTVDASGELQKSEDKPDGGGDKPRQSHWGVPGGSSQPSGPLIWGAYIHVGL